MLKVKGFSNGYLHPIAEIPCEKETVHVGLFSIGPYSVKGGIRFELARGILARSVGGKSNPMSQSNRKKEMRGRVAGVEADGRCEARNGLPVFSNNGKRKETADLMGDMTCFCSEKATRVMDGSKLKVGLIISPQNMATVIAESCNCKRDFIISARLQSNNSSSKSHLIDNRGSCYPLNQADLGQAQA